MTFLLIGIGIGAAIGGTMNGISAYNDGQRGWGLFGAIAGGAVMGGAMGAALVLGGAAGLSSIGLGVAGFGLSTGAAFGISIAAGVGAGLISYSLENGLRSDREWTIGGFALAGVSGGAKAAVTFQIGRLGGKMGGFDKMILKPMLKGASTLSTKVTYGIGKGIMASTFPSFLRTFAGGFFASKLTFSAISAGARWLIDLIFGT